VRHALSLVSSAPSDVRHLFADYLSPQTFASNLVECMKNDWALSGKSLLELLPGVSKLSASVAGATIALDFKQRLREDPTALQTITTAYLELAVKAKERRKPDDPWPVIIIDEANRLSNWKDKDALEQLLAFFVYLTKQKQLAHGESGRLAESVTRAWQASSHAFPRSDPRH